MTEFVGADLAAMSRLHQSLLDSSNAVASIRNNVDVQVNRIDALWSGPDAADFRHSWTSLHRPSLQQAGDALLAAAEMVERNRLAQQQTSNSLDRGAGGSAAVGGGSTPGGNGATGQSGSGDDSDDGIGLNDAHEFVDDLVGWLGLEGEAVAMLMAVLDGMSPEARAQVLALFKSFPIEELAGVLDAMGGVLDVVSFVSTFAHDMGQQLAEGLPMDESIVHALAESAAEFGVGQGIERFSQYLGGAAAASVTAGVGAPVGAAIGWVVGMGISQAAQAGMEAIDGYEAIADATTEIYRAVKQGAEFLYNTAGEIVGLAGDGIELLGEGALAVLDGAGVAVGAAADALIDVGSGAVNLAQDVGSGAVGLAEDVGGGVVDVASSVLSWRP